MNIKVSITDDHPMVRTGLESMLRKHPHIEVLDVFAGGGALLAGLQKRQPDILLLDLQLPDKDGQELLPLIKRSWPDIGVIILTSNNSVYNIKMLLNAGADGYVLKNAEQELLIAAIEEVYQERGVFLSPEVKERISREAPVKNSITAHQYNLTPRETDILKLIAEEYTSHEIGARLHLSYRTVETYRLGLMQKLGVKNMVGMTKKAIMMGIV